MCAAYRVSCVRGAKPLRGSIALASGPGGLGHGVQKAAVFTEFLQTSRKRILEDGGLVPPDEVEEITRCPVGGASARDGHQHCKRETRPIAV